MAHRPVRLGIVGAGYFGQHAHIANYAEIKDCRIVALAAGRPELRRKVAQRYGIPRTYATHQELLKDPQVEAVVVVTARPGIGPVALDCLKAGKHLLTEKPMASTLEQAEKLVGVQQEHKTYAVGYMKRYDAGVLAAKKILDGLLTTGELGAVLYTRIHCFAGDAYCKAEGHIVTNEKKTTDWETWAVAPEWVPDGQKQEYHQYLNMYCHDINLLRYLFGKTPVVSNVQFNDPGYKLAILDFGGHSALLETGSFPGRVWDENVEIYFAHGRLRIELPPALLRDVPAKLELWRGNVQETPPLHSGPSWSFKRQAEAFVQDAAGGNVSLSSGADSLEDIRLIETMWKMGLKDS